MATDLPPFCDSALVQGSLYATADRLARRTDALHRAKTSGRHAAHVIAELAQEALGNGTVFTMVEIGGGRGTTSRVVSDYLAPATMILVDASAALLESARERLRTSTARASYVRADFHALPVRDDACQLAVAAFCLYHSPRPEVALGAIARCLAPGGTAILATKSVDSYRELDRLLAVSGLDPWATTRASLYATAHSGNLTRLAGRSLTVRRILHEKHRFRFEEFTHLAEYLATSPKYVLPEQIRGKPTKLAAALRRSLPEKPVTTTSTVTYLVATKPPRKTGAL